MLTMEVQRLLGFINIKTDLELCLVDQQAKPDSTHNTLQASGLCKPVTYNFRNMLGFRKAFVCPCRALFDFPHSLTLGKKLHKLTSREVHLELMVNSITLWH